MDNIMVKDLLSNCFEDVLRNGVAKLPDPDIGNANGKLYYSREKDSVCLIDDSYTHMYVLPEGALITCYIYGWQFNTFILMRKISEESGEPIWYFGVNEDEKAICWKNDEMDGIRVSASLYADIFHPADMFDFDLEHAISNLPQIQPFAETMPYAQHQEFRSLDAILGNLDEKKRNIAQVYIMHVLKNIPVDEEILEMIRKFDNQYRASQKDNCSYQDCLRSIGDFIMLLEYHVVCARMEKPFLLSAYYEDIKLYYGVELREKVYYWDFAPLGLEEQHII